MRVVRRPAFIQPRVRLPVVGVILPFAISISHRTDQANFIPIVNSGRARHGHLHRHCALETLDCKAPIVHWVLIECRIILVGIGIKHEEGTVGVVAIEQVQHGLQALGVIALHQVLDALVELRGGERREFTSRGARGMVIISERRIAPEGKHCGAKLIIHHCVPLAA